MPPSITSQRRLRQRALSLRDSITHPTGALQHVLAAPTAVALIALVLRAVSLSTAYDVHVDELIYLNIAENVAQHLRVDFYAVPFLSLIHI